MIMRKRLKGYTLIELLVGTGVLSLATIGIYTIAMFAFDWRRVNQEVKLLNIVMKEIDNSTLGNGSYENINLLELEKMGIEFNSALQLININSTDKSKLNFEYSGVSKRVCVNFVEKMLGSNNNIDVLVNNQKITNKNLNDILYLCNMSNINDVKVVLNKTQDDYTIDNVVASVNPPPAPVPDMIIPDLPIPSNPPVIVGFTPSIVNPINYLISGSAPTFDPILVEKRDIVVTPGENNIVVNPPHWIPPVVIIPGATPAPADNLDQDPNPPAPPPPPPPPDDISLSFNRVCFVMIITGLESPTCTSRSGTYNTKISSFNGEAFRRWALNFGPTVCPYPYAASNISIFLNDLGTNYQANYMTNSWFPPYIPTAYVGDMVSLSSHGLLSVSIYCSGFN